MDREWINGGAKCGEESRVRGMVARIPRASPTTARSNGQAAAVHISPKQLHCFSHNEGARARILVAGVDGFRLAEEYRENDDAVKSAALAVTHNARREEFRRLRRPGTCGGRAEDVQINCHCTHSASYTESNPELPKQRE